MRKILTFLFAALMSVGTMFADGTKIGDLYYNLDAVNMTAEVTYKSYADYSFNEGWDITTANIPASVEYNSVTYSVTSIGQCAFQSCTGLTSVTIPNSVTSIGNQAFDHCESLTSVTIGNSVTSIGSTAFESCSNLTSITIPNSVTSIGNYAFNWCSGLTSIEIPNSVTSIGNYAFYQCTGLTSVTIGNSVTSIGNSTFYNCTGVTDVYCYPDAADLTWANGKFDFKASKATVCHVHADQLSAYQEKFTSTVRVTFVGELPIIPNVDPQNASVYYSTFFDSANKYALPTGVEAYVATISEDALLLTKIAEAGQVIPNDNAVILKSTVTPFNLTLSGAEAVTFSATNDLQGTDVAIATPDNCYVLSGHSSDNSVTGVGFYQYTGANLNPHKAYVVFGGSSAPRRMRFIFAEEQTATGTENASADNDESQKRMENGVLIVIKNGVRYNAQGQIVK